MSLSWRQRLLQEPRWQDINEWPLVDTRKLSPGNRRRFQRNLTMVSHALGGRRLKLIADEYHVAPGTVTKLLNRCLGGNADEDPPLGRGLLGYQRLNSSQRHTELSTLTEPRGAACAFSHLLETVPGLREHLETHIRHAVKRSRRGQNLKPSALHAVFIRYLEEQHWPHDRYPYTEASRAAESVRQFMIKHVAELEIPRPPKRVILPRLQTRRLFTDIHIDAHTVDCHGAVALVFDKEMQPLRVSRITLLQARDVGTGCTLAYTVALTRKPSADDTLALLEQLTRPWEPLTLRTPGLTYPQGPGFPSSIHADFRRPAFGMIRVDNALEHLATTVRNYVVDELGAALNWGLPAQPKGRLVIEEAFRRLNVDIHRLPSTTGSHPQDPLKEPQKHQKRAPVLSLSALEEMLSVLITEHNQRLLGNQGGVSPLDQACYQMANHLLALRSPDPRHQLSAFLGERIVFVRKPQKSQGSPRINFEKVIYQGAAINEAPLINQRVRITFDRRDIRTLNVYTLDGRHLGAVSASRTWQRFAHSLATRKHINALLRENAIARRDPLVGYFNYLLEHRELPTNALELVRIAREFGLVADIPPEPPPSHPSYASKPPARGATKSEIERALEQTPSWHPGLVHNRRETP